MRKIMGLYFFKNSLYAARLSCKTKQVNVLTVQYKILYESGFYTELKDYVIMILIPNFNFVIK